MTSSSMKNQWIFVLLNREKDEEITLNEFCADFKHFFDENVAQNEIFIPSNENPLNLEMRRDGEFNISLKENFADFIENCDEIGSDEEEEDDGDTFYPILAQTTRNFFIEVKIIGEKVENCEHFWLNPASSFAAYNRFLMNLNAFYYDTGKLSRCGPNFVIRNYHYAVKIGQLWRRGRAKTCDGENGFYLIDEGGFRSYEEISEVKKLRPKFAEFPAQAFKCGLNIKEPEIARLNAVRFKGIVSELRMCGRKIEANIIKRSTERNFQCPSLIVELAKEDFYGSFVSFYRDFELSFSCEEPDPEELFVRSNSSRNEPVKSQMDLVAALRKSSQKNPEIDEMHNSQFKALYEFMDNNL